MISRACRNLIVIKRTILQNPCYQELETERARNNVTMIPKSIYKQAKIDPSVKRHFNGVSLVGQQWPETGIRPLVSRA